MAFKGQSGENWQRLACKFYQEVLLSGELVVEVLKFYLPSRRGGSKGSDLLCKMLLGAGGSPLQERQKKTLSTFIGNLIVAAKVSPQERKPLAAEMQYVLINMRLQHDYSLGNRQSQKNRTNCIQLIDRYSNVGSNCLQLQGEKIK